MPSKPLAELLDRVDSQDLWSASVNDIHLWPIVRSAVLRTSLRREARVPVSSRRPRSPLRTAISTTKAVAEQVRYLRATTRPLNDALFFVPTVLFVPEREGGRYVDRLYSEYYKRLRRPLIVELSSQGHESRRRGETDAEVVSFPSLWSLARARGVLGRWTSRDARTVRAFAGTVTSAFDLPQTMADVLERSITTYVRAYPHVSSALERRLLHRAWRPVAFVHTASYLGLYGLIARSLKDRGCRVIELQHGSTHGLHYAYHFSPEVLSTPTHPVRSYLPDDLLVYGRHWAGQTTTPSRTVVVGYPYLSTRAERSSSVAPDPSRALLVLQGESTRDTLPRLTAELASLLPRMHLVVKAHPGEAADLDRYDALSQLANVEVTAEANVYDLLGQSGIVIGYSSTVLYEAAAFYDTRVFVLRNQYVSEDVGDHFSSAAELARMIADPRRGRSKIDPNDLFDPGWQANLETYLHSLGLPARDP